MVMCLVYKSVQLCGTVQWAEVQPGNGVVIKLCNKPSISNSAEI